METSILKERRVKTIHNIPDNSVFFLFSSPRKVRNHDVLYQYRQNSDFLYLTGIEEHPAILILDSDGNENLYISEQTSEKRRWLGESLGIEGGSLISGINLKNIHLIKNFSTDIPQLIRNKDNIVIDFISEQIAFDKIRKIISQELFSRSSKDFVPTNIIHPSPILNELRLKKTKEELELMRKAARISAIAHNYVIEATRNLPFPTHEYVIRGMLEGKFLENGAGQLAYPSIVAGGVNTTVLHYEHSIAKINSKDLILIDAGVEIEGYASDITRTFPAGGKFTSIQKSVYEAVLNAQKIGLSLSKVGSNLEEIHKATIRSLTEFLWEESLIQKIPAGILGEKSIESASIDEAISQKAYRAFYMHRTSHFIGLDVHDPSSYFINHKPRIFEPGMVFTVEPGLYFPKEYNFIPEVFQGIGVRIEDDVVITDEEPEIISTLAKKEIAEISLNN